MKLTSAKQFVTRQLERPDALGTLFRGASYLLCAAEAAIAAYGYCHGFDALAHSKDEHDVVIACLTVLGGQSFGVSAFGLFLTTSSASKTANGWHWRKLDKAIKNVAKNAPKP